MPRGVRDVKPDEVDETLEAPDATETPDEDVQEPVVDVKPDEADGRRERFEAVRPDGTVVIVDRNIDTGEQTVTEK